MDTIRWISGVTLRYDSLDINNFRQYGDELFTCEVRYRINHQTSYETNDIEGNFIVLFVLSDGRWLAAKMIAI